MSVQEAPPRRRRAADADWDGARTLYPAIDDAAADWATALAASPDTLFTMIADIVKVAKATEGPRRTGRRPAVSGLSFDEVWETLYPPRYTTELFPLALRRLVGARPQRRFAATVPCSQATLSRLVNGTLVPDLALIENVAAAAKVPPGYFVEYRAGKLAAIVTATLTARPELSITLLKRLRGTS